MRRQKKIPYAHVAIAAGGLGTRRSELTLYLPKEHFPVGGKPGITLLLEEAAKLGRVRAVLVHHPYYADFVSSRARPVLENSHHGHTAPHGAAPKLSLALAAYARNNRVRICPTHSSVTDLGAPLRNA